MHALTHPATHISWPHLKGMSIQVLETTVNACSSACVQQVAAHKVSGGGIQGVAEGYAVAPHVAE